MLAKGEVFNVQHELSAEPIENSAKLLQNILADSPKLSPAEVLDLIEPLSRGQQVFYDRSKRTGRDIKDAKKSREVIQKLGKQYLQDFLSKNPSPLEIRDYQLLFSLPVSRISPSKIAQASSAITVAGSSSRRPPSFPKLDPIQPAQIDQDIGKISDAKNFENALSTLFRLSGDSPEHFAARRKYFEAFWKADASSTMRILDDEKSIQLIRAVDLHPAYDRPDLSPENQEALDHEYQAFRKFCLEDREPKILSAPKQMSFYNRVEVEALLPNSKPFVRESVKTGPIRSFFRCFRERVSKIGF
jgi:hypothetical protein